MGEELPKHLMWQNFNENECYRALLVYADKVLETATKEMMAMEDDDKANQARKNIKYAKEFLSKLKSMAIRLNKPEKQTK